MGKRRKSASRRIAYGVLSLDIFATLFVLAICWRAVDRNYTGSLPYLTALIAALQAATAVVLSRYFRKSQAENTTGGIVYDAAMRDC